LSVFNTDTAPATIVLIFKDGSNRRIIRKKMLHVGNAFILSDTGLVGADGEQ